MTTSPKIQFDTSKGWDMCFGCGKKNPIGLKLKVEWDGKVARAEFTPNELNQGWWGFVHGGILTTLLDELMGYAGIFNGYCCVTAKLQARFILPAPIDNPLIITGSVVKNNRKTLDTQAKIVGKDGKTIAEAEGTLFILGPMTDELADKQGEPRI